MRNLLAHRDDVRARFPSRRARSSLLQAGLRPKTWWAEPNIRTWLTPLVVAAAYYAGTLVGLSVRFQSSPISPIWPPNTILLVALLLVPVRRWWVCLLAAFGAHMLAEVPDGIPLLTALGFYLTNAGEAVLGAYLVRRLIGGAPWLGSPRRVALYLVCAVLVVPFSTSFLDAAVVVLTRWGDNYWLTFRMQWVSDSLAALTIGTALLLGLTGTRDWVRRAGRWRRAEAVLLAIGLLLVGVVAFGGDVRDWDMSPALLSILLPFMLWAAVRFGVGGTSATLLGITALSMWSAVQGRGPFSMYSPAGNVMSLQLFLIGMSVPSLFLAALLQEREETKAALQESETRFRTMADHAPVLIWMSGLDALCTFFNANWLTFRGRTLEQERGVGWAEGVHPDDQAGCLERYQTAFAARLPFTMEYRLRRHDGVYRWMVDNGIPLYAPDGRFDGYIGSAVDVTDRKHMEQTLHASEERYRDLVESQPEMICRYLPDSTLTFVNEAYCQWHGRPREELIGTRFLDRLDEPARERHIQYAATLVAHPQISVDEHEVILPDGSPGWVQWVDHPICDADGRVVELQAHGRDITARKRAEEALRASEARFRAAFESAATGMMLVGTDGHPLRVNRPIVEMFGYSEEELRGRTFSDFTHPDDVDTNLDLFHRALAGEIDTYHLEKRFIHKGGHVVWGMVSAGVVRDGEGRPLYIVGHVQDITDRKQAELALRESEERYLAVVNNFPRGTVLLFGQDLRHLFAGGQGLSQVGLSREGIEGKTISEAFPADLSDALTPRYRAALSGMHASFDLIYAGHIYQTQILPVQYAGTMAGMAVMQDVTEQRRAQALAELDRAKTAFIANVSHEFRTPLTLLLGPAADALADREEPPTPRQRERLEIIERSGLRLHRLVNTLLDFSSIEAGRLTAAFEPADVAGLTAEFASTFRSAIERAGLRLVVDSRSLSTLRQPVYVDRNMWEKIVLNLLSNALKFTFEGEIVVSLRPADGGESVELEVRDTGVGIPNTELPHLFERFYRVPGARGRTHEGTGIGLALVQELVQLHGGTVRVASTVDVGSSFTVAIPVGTAHLPTEYVGSGTLPTTTSSPASDAPAAAAFVGEALRWLSDPPSTSTPKGSTAPAAATPRAAPSHTVPLGASNEQETASPDAQMHRDREGGHEIVEEAERIRGHILVADDNADMRAYLNRLLGERWEVQAVADGSAALTEARARPPDLILADVMMPGLDGVALLHALRADTSTRAIPVLLLSARAGEEATVEGLAAGADDYLVKPFAARELLARVRTHLEHARVREAAAVRAAQLNAIFEAVPDGVFVLDAGGHVRRINPAARVLFGQARGTGAPCTAEARAQWLDLRDAEGRPLSPGQLPTVRLLRGEELVGADAMTLMLRTPDGRERTVSLTGGPLRDAAGQVVGAVGVVRDVTELKRFDTALRQSEERFSKAFHASPLAIAITSLTSQRILDVNEAAIQLTGYSRAAMLGRTAPELGAVGPDIVRHLRALRSLRMGLRDAPVRVRTTSGEVRHCLVSTEVIRLSGEECLLTIVHDVTEREQAAEELRRAMAAAEAAKREEEQRRHEAERREQIAGSLRDVLTILNSSRDVTMILDYIAGQAGRLLGSDAAAIYTTDGVGGSASDRAPIAPMPLTLQAAYGLRATNDMEHHLAPAHAALRRAMAERRPVAALGVSHASRESVGTTGLDGSTTDGSTTDGSTTDGSTTDGSTTDGVVEAATGCVEMRAEILPAPYRALLVIPIVALDQVYGGILLLYSEPRRFTADEVALVAAYGDQVALAMTNARLQDHIEREAIGTERNRIARELHDTVTQEIFSANLQAQVIPRIWEQNRAEAERSLHELNRLTRGALATLRALLLELRPAVLEQKALADLLRQLGDAMTNRAGVPIALTVTDDLPPLPTEVKFALYRIAQEAMTNASRHAAANHIVVRLASPGGGETIRIEVIDDGQGFEPGAVPAGHFGIDMMHERAHGIGAILRISSQAGQGTRVVLDWKGVTNREANNREADTVGAGGTGREETHGRARK